MLTPVPRHRMGKSVKIFVYVVTQLRVHSVGGNGSSNECGLRDEETAFLDNGIIEDYQRADGIHLQRLSLWIESVAHISICRHSGNQFGDLGSNHFTLSSSSFSMSV